MSGTNNPARRAAELYRQKADLEAQLTQVKAKIAELSEPAMDWMIEQGLIRAPFDELGTLHMRQEVWASVRSDASITAVKAAIAAAGHNPDDIIKEKANAQTLSAFIRELQAGEGVPEELSNLLNISETTKLGFRSNG